MSECVANEETASVLVESDVESVAEESLVLSLSIILSFHKAVCVAKFCRQWNDDLGKERCLGCGGGGGGGGEGGRVSWWIRRWGSEGDRDLLCRSDVAETFGLASLVLHERIGREEDFDIDRVEAESSSG